MELQSHFSIWDYVVVVISLLSCAGVGLFAGRGSVQGVSNYLLAGRTMSILPVSFSVMATLLSAIAISGGIGEMYFYGVQFLIMTVVFSVTSIAVGILIVPIFHNMEYTSIYEYLEKRFDRSTRLGFSFLFILINVAYLAIVLYLPAISLTAVTGIPYWVASIIFGITGTIYCVFGGFKAVIWTDVLQSILMFSSISLVFIKGLIHYGSFADAWEIAYQGGFFSLVWTESASTRYSVWSTCAYGMLIGIKDFTINQAGVQRLLSVRSADDAKRSIYISAAIAIAFRFILLLLGVVTYASFSSCDPPSYKESRVRSMDQVYIFSIWKFLTDVPGLAGLAFSGIISGSLSTYSSYINAFAALTLEDFIKPFFPEITTKERRNVLICKLLTGAYSLAAILLSFLVPYAGSSVKVYSTVIIATAGPLCGLMCLGFFVTKANSKVSKLALVLGTIPCLWIVIGSLVFPTTYERIHFGTEDCPKNLTFILPVVSTANSTTNRYDLPLYHISFMWFGPIGFVVTMISGWILSLFIGSKEPADPMLLSPFVCKRQPQEETHQLEAFIKT